MRTLEDEALLYAGINPEELVDLGDERIKDAGHFIAGANSKWVQAEKIKAQIEVYLSCIPFICDEEYRIEIRKRIEIGEKLLKQLEDGNSGI